jgi:ribosome production factor 1
VLVVLGEDNQKKPSTLDMVMLPLGPLLRFSIQMWVEGKKLPGHGNATDHRPELV